MGRDTKLELIKVTRKPGVVIRSYREVKQEAVKKAVLPVCVVLWLSFLSLLAFAANKMVGGLR